MTAPLSVIGRKELAQIGDEQILDAVAIDVGQRDVRGVRDARDDRQRAAGLRGMTGEDQPLPHVGAEHVEPLVAVEIDERARSRRPGVPGMSGMVRPRRAKRTGDSLGGRPGFRRRETFGCAAGVERQHLLHVRRQLNRAVTPWSGDRSAAAGFRG